MSAGGQDTWQIVEDGLYQLISQATASGGVLAVQPNADGTTGIQLVDRIVPPERNVYPQIGLMAHLSDESPVVAHARDIVITFDIVIAVRQPQSDTVPDTASAALQSLRNYQNDGNGNGLSPLLRENVTLFGLVDRSLIRRMERVLMKGEANSAESVALAIYTYEAYTRVKL